MVRAVGRIVVWVDAEAEVFCASYTNFYICNGAIIMPAYGIAADEEAAATLRMAFPGREVVAVQMPESFGQ